MSKALNIATLLASSTDRPTTRRALLRGLAIGGAGLALGGARAGSTLAATGYEPAGQIASIALTAEYLAVTYLGNILANSAKLGLPAKAITVLNAARAAEQDHVRVLQLLGAQPLTDTFSLSSFLTDLPTVVTTLVTLETAFIAAYLTAQRELMAAGANDLALLASRIMGVEAEHRVLARDLGGYSPPNNVSFEDTSFATVGDAATALTGLGLLSPSGSNSYTYPGPGVIDYTGVIQRYP